MGDYITIADFKFYELLNYYRALNTAEFDKIEVLQAYIKRIEELKGVKEYLASDRFAAVKKVFLPSPAAINVA